MNKMLEEKIVSRENKTKRRIKHICRSGYTEVAICGVKRKTPINGVIYTLVGVTCKDCLMKASIIWPNRFV